MPLNTRHFVPRLALCSIGSLLIPEAADACPVCFGAVDGLMLRGSNMGILALLVATLAVLAAFGGFFVSLARRAARAEPPIVGAESSGGRQADVGAAVR
jgi:hypothetical protein